MTIFDEVPKEVLLTELHAEVRKVYAQRRQVAEMGEPVLAQALGSDVIAAASAAEQFGFIGQARVVYDTVERLFPSGLMASMRRRRGTTPRG
jgi:hypothetical protein